MRRAMAALLLVLVAMPASAAALDASDAPAGAPALEDLPPDFAEAIDRPGDLDWYSLRGLDIGGGDIQKVQVSIVAPGTDCTAAPPLVVTLLIQRCGG